MEGILETRLKQFRDNMVTNWHDHFWVFGASGYEACKPHAERLVRDAKLAGMDRIVVSNVFSSGVHGTKDEIAKGNDAIAQCCAEYPGFLYGLAYIDPLYCEDAIAEIKRCRENYHFLGIKLYNQYTIDHKLQDLILDYCAQEHLVALMHAFNRPHHLPRVYDFTTDSSHMAQAAIKHPDTKMIMAHLPGGGDWNYQLRGIEDKPNVYVDISGSVTDAGMVEALVERIGADRILFGTDGSFSAAIGRLFEAEISDEDRLKIMNNQPLWDYVTGGIKS